jgi:hypothetical protein
MFHELSLDEIDSLVLELRNILLTSYKEVKTFQLENSEYVPNHPSGDWYNWERREVRRISSRYGDLHFLRFFIEAINENNFENAEKYYSKTMEIHHNFHTTKIMEVA